MRCVEGARFELQVLIADALRRWFQQRCGYFQCEQRTLEHCCSQRSSIPCSHVTAESRIGDIRGR
jgi:hypothetical protein